MTEKERREERSKQFTMLMIQLQIGLLPFVKTYGDLFDTFGSMMRKATGDYTEDDEQWAEEALQRFEKHNAPKPSKKKEDP